MSKRVVCVSILVLGVVVSVSCRPVGFEQDELLLQDMHDTATVESIVREARAAPQHIGDLIKPGVKDAFIYTYGDAEGAAGDHHGYAKKTNGKGRQGYKHFDSFHKKDGDKYGYEKHSEYGQENKDKVDTDDDKKKEESDDDGEETKHSYRVLEEANEDDNDHKKAMEEDFGSYEGAGSANESESYHSESGNAGDGEGDKETSYDYAESSGYSEGSESGDGGEEGGESEGGYDY